MVRGKQKGVGILKSLWNLHPIKTKVFNNIFDAQNPSNSLNDSENGNNLIRESTHVALFDIARSKFKDPPHLVHEAFGWDSSHSILVGTTQENEHDKYIFSSQACCNSKSPTPTENSTGPNGSALPLLPRL